MPRLQALVALHGFWMMLLVLPTAWLLVRASPIALRVTGAAVFWGGILGLTVVAGRGLVNWLLTSWESSWQFAGHRLLYVAATETDLPFGQIALAGAVCLLVGRRRMRQQTDYPASGH
jgi:hypothetical protein